MKTTDANQLQAWCLVRVDAQPLAVALSAVVEIVEAEELIRLPLCSPRVLGLCTYRRDLIPVVSLSDVPDDAPGPTPRGRPSILIVRGEQGAWGLRIDRVGATVAEGAVDDRRPSTAGTGGAVVFGSITRGGTTHAAIDPEATWRNLRDAIERGYKGDRGLARRHGA